MIVATGAQFSAQDFNTLDESGREALYQAANESHDVDLVRKLNEMGMKPWVPSFSGPTIVSSYMDIATKHDVIFGFLNTLRETGKLLTEGEFESLSSKKWMKKDGFSRLIGCDHLTQIITELGLKHIKVPLKIAVVQEADSLEVSGWNYRGNLFDIDSDQLTVYAERITSEYRKLSRDEIDELIQVIAASNFVDLWPANIVVAKDGIYFIDTEFKSFEGRTQWEKMQRFMPLISHADKAYFKEKVEEKMNEPRTRRDLGYDEMAATMEIYEGLPPSEIEKSKTARKLRRRMARLEYVGAKEVGSSWVSPNKFSFSLEELMT